MAESVKQKEKCSAEFYSKVGRFGQWSPCGSNGRFECDGKRYCGIHYPPNVEVRERKNMAKYKAEIEANRIKYREQSLAYMALAWMRENKPEIVKVMEAENG